jgi:hypothetical protein
MTIKKRERRKLVNEMPKPQFFKVLLSRYLGF